LTLHALRERVKKRKVKQIEKENITNQEKELLKEDMLSKLQKRNQSLRSGHSDSQSGNEMSTREETVRHSHYGKILQPISKETDTKINRLKIKRKNNPRLRREVEMRDGPGCSARDPKTGERCGTRKFLELHHVVPLAEGGSDTLGNAKVWCSGHHRSWHILRERSRFLEIQ
jgi:5-methylcytosine-specific restriction endonuclease McrA